MRFILIKHCSGILLLLKFVTAQIDTSTSGSCTEQGLRICAGSEYFNYDDYSDYNYDDYSDYNYDLDCYCDEACLSLRDCCTDIYQLEYCGEFRGSECISGSVRLVGGSTPYEGLVEICIFQSWQPVCESSFSYPEAKVTCNSLGYSASPDSFDDVSNFLEYTNITNVTTYWAVCEGDESRLTECLVDFQFCQENDKQASVNCSPGCTSSCNTQLNDSQYQLCCDTKNHGKFLQVINEDDDTVYLVCPIETPDWC